MGSMDQIDCTLDRQQRAEREVESLLFNVMQGEVVCYGSGYVRTLEHSDHLLRKSVRVKK